MISTKKTRSCGPAMLLQVSLKNKIVDNRIERSRESTFFSNKRRAVIEENEDYLGRETI